MGRGSCEKDWEHLDCALYHDDEFIMIGKIKEIAEYMQIKLESAKTLTYPSSHKRSKQKIIIIEED